MASKLIGTVEVVKEGSYGSIDAATGAPTAPVAGWQFLEIGDRAEIVEPGDLVQVEYTGNRAGAHTRPAEQSTFSTSLLRRKATMTLSTPMRGGMTENLALGYLLETAFDVLNAQATPSDTVQAPITASSYTTANAGRYVPGAIVGFAQAGRWVYDAVHSVGGGVVSFLHEFVANPTASQIARLPYCYSLPSEGMPTSTVSCALRITGSGWTALCYGVTLTKVSGAMDEASRRMMLTLELDIAHVDYVESGTPAAHGVPSGAVCHQLGSYIALGETVGQDTLIPIGESIDQRLCADAFSFEVTITRAAPGCGETLIARSGAEIVDASVMVNMITGTPVASLSGDLGVRNERQLLAGFGGGGAGAVGNGGAVYIPRAVLMSDPAKRETGKDYLRSTVNYGADRAETSANASLPTFVLAIGA